MSTELLSAIPTEQLDELPEYHLDTVWVFDYDRTLGQVGPSRDRLLDLGQLHGISPHTILESQNKIESDGGSFDPLHFFEASLGKVAFSELCDAFIEPLPYLRKVIGDQAAERTSKEPHFRSIIYSDASRIIDDVEIPRLIMTYGVNPQWQYLKTAASGYAGYVHIMEHSKKGPVIESWQNSEGYFDFLGVTEQAESQAIYHAKKIILVDDKAVSFEDLPEACEGVYLRRPDEPLLPSQKGALPPNVSTIATLKEIINHPDYATQPFEAPLALIPLHAVQKAPVRIGSIIMPTSTQQELDSLTA